MRMSNGPTTSKQLDVAELTMAEQQAASSRPECERVASESSDAEVLANIYDPGVNIAVWKRAVDPQVHQAVHTIFSQCQSLKLAGDVSPASASAFLTNRLDDFDGAEVLSRDIANLVDMFCCLFQREDAGLRLTMLEHAMCPRFHTDKVPCRLVTTYNGSATQWLPHALVDRSKLGHGNNGLPDNKSGIYQHPSDMRQLEEGDVALLKGELWDGNEGAGLVHRSPELEPNEKRLLLTLDFIG